MGDFDGDRHDDVLLRHADSGQWIYYPMGGPKSQPVRRFGPTPNRDWALAGIGDLNGDGYDDILLRHANSGQWLYYAIQGTRSTLIRNLGLSPRQVWVPAMRADGAR